MILDDSHIVSENNRTIFHDTTNHFTCFEIPIRSLNQSILLCSDLYHILIHEVISLFEHLFFCDTNFLLSILYYFTTIIKSLLLVNLIDSLIFALLPNIECAIY